MTAVAELLADSGLGDLASEPESAVQVAATTLELVGGPSALLDEARELSNSPLLPELIMTTNAIDPESFGELDDIIEAIRDGFENERRPLMVGYIADALIASPTVVSRLGASVDDSFRSRYRDALSTGDGHLAYKLLETLVRLALSGLVNKFRVLADLSEVSPAGPVDFVERIPKLIGIVADVFDQNDLSEVLETFLSAPQASTNAAVELGTLELKNALERTNLPDVLAGLQNARQRFAAATSEEGRDDAKLYCSAIDAILAFATPTDIAKIREAADAIESVAIRRGTVLDGMHEVDWFRRRTAAEAQWAAYVLSIRHAADDLNRASWLQPYEALERVLNVYRSSRAIPVTLPAAQGVMQSLIEPTIEAAFVRREGLLAHLRDALSEGLGEFDSESAGCLLERVEELLAASDDANFGSDPGKVVASAPALTAALGVGAANRVLEGLAQKDVAELERLVVNRRQALDVAVNPIQEAILTHINDNLGACDDYIGIVGARFDILVETILKFMSYRADVGRTSGGSRIDYLFADFADRHSDEPIPRERWLQNDLREWLGSGPLSDVVDVEVMDIASGRADIKVGFGGLRFLIEVKRETVSASRSALRKHYSGQAAAYSGTNANLGLLMVLDLTDHSQGFPSLRDSFWVERVPLKNGSDRYLVVGVVHGNRVTPSLTKGPS
jgi:hypothetical protein